MTKLYAIELSGDTYVGPASELGRFYSAGHGLTIINLAPRANGERIVAFYSSKSNAWQECGTIIDQGDSGKNLEAAFELFFLETAVKDGAAHEVDPITPLYRLLRGELDVVPESEDISTEESPSDEPPIEEPETGEPDPESEDEIA